MCRARHLPTLVLGACVCVAILGASGCKGAGSGSDGSSAEETSTSEPATFATEPLGDMLAQVQAAFEQTHPGFAYLDALGDVDGWLVVGQSSVAPDLIVRVLMRPDGSGAITTTVGETTWSTRGAIREFTDDGTALPADRRLALMQIVAAEWGGADSGGFCSEVVVSGDDEAVVTVSSDTGDRIDVPYVYDTATGEWVRQDPPTDG